MKTLTTLIIVFVLSSVILSTLNAQEESSPIPSNTIRELVWNPTHDQIAISTQIGMIEVINMSGEGFVLNRSHSSPIQALTWNQTGTKLAAGLGNQIVIWDLSSRSELTRMSTETGNIRSLAWSPDERYIVSSSPEGFPNNVQVWDVTTQNNIFSPMVGDVLSVAWSPNGSQLAVTKFGEIQLWDVLGQIRTQTIYTPEYSLDMAWSPDGLSIASADAYVPDEATVRIWDISSGRLLREFIGHQDVITDVDWSIDGQQLATSSHDNTVRIWDVWSGEVIHIYEGDGSFFSVSYSPYGGRLAYGQAFDPASSQTIPFQIVIPAPSLERLAAIAELCVQDSATRSAEVNNLTRQAPAALDDLPAFVAQVEALSDDAIPPACKADLLAVASVLGE